MAAKEGANDLLCRLRKKPALLELTVNPLLLTMIATVHRNRSALPGRRVELYAEICEVFLGKRQQARGLELEMTPPQKQRVLEPLAYYMMQTKKRDIIVSKAIEVIASTLEQVQLNTPETGTWDVWVKAGVINQGLQGYALIASGNVSEEPACADADADSVCDIVDNCPLSPNPNQDDPVRIEQTILAGDTTSFSWHDARDIDWVRGDLAGVDIYDVIDLGSAAAATSISTPETPTVGEGFYWLLRPDCVFGSWSSGGPSEDGDRDGNLPPP